MDDFLLPRHVKYMALEPAKHNPMHQDIASGFFNVCRRTDPDKPADCTCHPSTIQHFIFTADAMTYESEEGEQSLWNEDAGMYFDAIKSNNRSRRLLVGLILPCYAHSRVSVINRFPSLRSEWNGSSITSQKCQRAI